MKDKITIRFVKVTAILNKRKTTVFRVQKLEKNTFQKKNWHYLGWFTYTSNYIQAETKKEAIEKALKHLKLRADTTDITIEPTIKIIKA